jgi:putative nucleotidyltransferase with HDIG domain
LYGITVTTLIDIPPPRSDAPRLSGSRAQRQLQTVIQVSRAIGSIRDQGRMMQVIMEQVTLAFNAERSSLYLHDAKKGELWTRVAQGLDSTDDILTLSDDEGLCGRAFQMCESICVHDTLNHPHFARRVAEKTGYVPHSMLLAPVTRTDGVCVGVLQVMDRRVGFFGEDDLPLLQAIAVQVGITLENTSLYEAQQQQFDSFVGAMSAALDARDPLTALHSVNVANYAMGIATILGLSRDDIEWLRIGGLLHDIGKIGVPEQVLTKAGKLSSEEFEEMKRHAEYSRKILSKIKFTNGLEGLDVISASHHEKLDGSGYPQGLKGDEISLKARILTVADIFDALTQTRHYRQAMTMHEALREISGMTPGKLDAQCVGALKAFLRCGPWPMQE